MRSALARASARMTSACPSRRARHGASIGPATLPIPLATTLINLSSAGTFNAYTSPGSLDAPPPINGWALRAFDPGHPGLTRAGQLLQMRALFLAQVHDISYVHHPLQRYAGDSRAGTARRVDPPEPSRWTHLTTGIIDGIHPCLHDGQRTTARSGRPAVLLRGHCAERSPDDPRPGAKRAPSSHPRTGTQPRGPRHPRGPSTPETTEPFQSIKTSEQRY